MLCQQQPGHNRKRGINAYEIEQMFLRDVIANKCTGTEILFLHDFMVVEQCADRRELIILCLEHEFEILNVQGIAFCLILAMVSSIVIFKSSIYRLTSLSLAVFPSDFCATADHDSERRCSFVGISYLCPEIVTRHERGDIFSFVLPFLIQKRTLKVCFFWFIVVFFENHSKYQKRAIVSPNLSPN